ncbi:MAG: ABC transporter ATP-binding protein [Bellilinea sp.]
MRYLVLRTENLRKDVHRRAVLKGITLELDPGEVFGLLGPRDAGKSTLLHILLDFNRPTFGQALIMGVDCQRNGLKVRKMVGYLPQYLSLPHNLTGEQLLQRLAELRGGVDWGYVAELEARLGADLRTSCDKLSSADQRKIGILQAFMHQPELVILDEPSQSLDSASQIELYRLIAEFRAEGRSVLVASQSLCEMERICDRVALLHQGRLIAIERGAQLRARAMRKIEMRFAAPIDPQVFSGLHNLNQLVCDQNKMVCTVVGDPDALIKTASRFRLLDIISQQPSLEEVYRTVYGIAEHAA